MRPNSSITKSGWRPPAAPLVPGAEAVAPARLLTVAEVALTLQVSERAVRRWIAEQRLLAVHLGRAVRIRPADLDRLIAVGLAGE